MPVALETGRCQRPQVPSHENSAGTTFHGELVVPSPTATVSSEVVDVRVAAGQLQRMRVAPGVSRAPERFGAPQACEFVQPFV